jgi:hypothetical protein
MLNRSSPFGFASSFSMQYCYFCWTKPTERLKMPCTHAYWTACFFDQVALAGEQEILLRTSEATFLLTGRSSPGYSRLMFAVK